MDRKSILYKHIVTDPEGFCTFTFAPTINRTGANVKARAPNRGKINNVGPKGRFFPTIPRYRPACFSHW